MNSHIKEWTLGDQSTLLLTELLKVDGFGGRFGAFDFIGLTFVEISEYLLGGSGGALTAVYAGASMFWDVSYIILRLWK